MKVKYQKAVENIRRRFDYAVRMGASARNTQENADLLNTLVKYGEYAENEISRLKERENELFLSYSALLEKFNRRGTFLQIHGYNAYAIEWIDEANTDFLDSELEIRKGANYSFTDQLLNWWNMEISYRSILYFARNDIEQIRKYRKFKAEGLHAIAKHIHDYMPENLRKYLDTDNEPKLSDLIRYHCFKPERYGN